MRPEHSRRKPGPYIALYPASSHPRAADYADGRQVLAISVRIRLIGIGLPALIISPAVTPTLAGHADDPAS